MSVIQDEFAKVFLVQLTTSLSSFRLCCILAKPLLSFLCKHLHSNLNEEYLHHLLVISYTLYFPVCDLRHRQCDQLMETYHSIGGNQAEPSLCILLMSKSIWQGHAVSYQTQLGFVSRGTGIEASTTFAHSCNVRRSLVPTKHSIVPHNFIKPILVFMDTIPST